MLLQVWMSWLHKTLSTPTQRQPAPSWKVEPIRAWLSCHVNAHLHSTKLTSAREWPPSPGLSHRIFKDVTEASSLVSTELNSMDTMCRRAKVCILMPTFRPHKIKMSRSDIMNREISFSGGGDLTDHLIKRNVLRVDEGLEEVMKNRRMSGKVKLWAKTDGRRSGQSNNV